MLYNVCNVCVCLVWSFLSRRVAGISDTGFLGFVVFPTLLLYQIFFFVHSDLIKLEQYNRFVFNVYSSLF